MISASLKSLTKRRLSRSETLDVLAKFNKFDDRTCAIIAVALLEHRLERALIRSMYPLSSGARDRLLFGSGPLATFSAKIRVARAFGIIGPKVAHDFERLNEIRNVFAHTAHPITFRDRRIRNRLAGLHNMLVVNSFIKALEGFRNGTKAYNNTRGRFVLVAGGYLQAFTMSRKGRHRNKQKPENEIIGL